MEFGLLLHTRQLIRSEDAAKSFDQLWSDAEQAEEIGFEHIWLGDSVTVLDKARGDCLTAMAALAARTTKIRLGVVPMLAALRNPVLLAHALATIDVISGGRIIIGVSVGPTRDYIQRQFAACGVPPQEKSRAFRRMHRDHAPALEREDHGLRGALLQAARCRDFAASSAETGYSDLGCC